VNKAFGFFEVQFKNWVKKLLVFAMVSEFLLELKCFKRERSDEVMKKKKLS